MEKGGIKHKLVSSFILQNLNVNKQLKKEVEDFLEEAYNQYNYFRDLVDMIEMLEEAGYLTDKMKQQLKEKLIFSSLSQLKDFCQYGSYILIHNISKNILWRFKKEE